MGWQLSGTPKTMKVTKDLAKQFAEMEPAPHDRPLSERRLQVYERLFREGSFRPCTWSSARCKQTGGIYRVNGKHTSTLLSGLARIPDFYVTVEEYECDTLEDVARLYATFDSKLMSRTVNDINRSFASTIPELGHVAARTVNTAVAALAYSTWGKGYNTDHQPAERAELMLEHPDFILWLDGLFSHAGASPAVARAEGRRSVQHLVRMAVVAAMFSTWNRAKGASTEFWTAVRDETDPSPQSPSRKLARYLLTTNISKGTGARAVRRADDREMHVKCLHAWNAWRKGETTELRYYPDSPVPGAK